MSVLPEEILNHIFSFLQSDTATLEKCSQSSPILSPLIERHLYTNVTVQDRCDKFLNVLHDRPYIANYVRVLKIKFRGSTVACLEELSPTLPKLLLLRRIELHYKGFLVRSWSLLPKRFRLAFLDCLRLPSLTDISISLTAFPLSIFSHCKHIRHLSLKFSWLNGTVPTAEGDNACLPAIDSLTLRDCDLFTVSAISSWMEARHLSSLEFSGPAMQNLSSSDSLQQILLSCSHSLTNLDVNIDTRYGSVYGSNLIATHPNQAIPIPLAHLRKLQQLTIRAQLYHVKNQSQICGFSSPIFAIANVLKPAFPFKRLILDLETVFEFHDYNDAQDQITNILCGPLHSLLVQSASTINSIDLRFMAIPAQENPGISISSSAITAMLASHSDLTQFVESGKIILTPIVWSQ